MWRRVVDMNKPRTVSQVVTVTKTIGQLAYEASDPQRTARFGPTLVT